MNLERAASFLQSHHTFYLAAHQSPDGDTLGSCLALRAALLALGKEATVVCPDRVPANLHFLEDAETVIGTEGIEPPKEAVVYVDCADHKRTGALCETLESAPYAFCIDHHGTNPRTSKDGDWVEDAGATGELILKLIDALSVPVTHGIAVALYTAIATDTGNFAYSNTTPESLRAAAELLSYGIDLPELNRILFREMTLPKAKLIAYALGEMELSADGRLNLVAIPEAVLSALGATKEDCEGLIDSLRDVDTVEAACVLKEADGVVRVSMRSKRTCDVAAIAKRFGGGGHLRAAGCTLELPLDEAKRVMREALTEALA
ncbi:MAG: bifunctional oligoribonuclease/PAP phosphatase NrnA [Clostridia bacterium]|nr:bifunctional oligoribonuclease/PAP phosphatase NrnA [Clostridia bacterium]